MAMLLDVVPQPCKPHLTSSQVFLEQIKFMSFCAPCRAEIQLGVPAVLAHQRQHAPSRGTSLPRAFARSKGILSNTFRIADLHTKNTISVTRSKARPLRTPPTP